MYRLLQQMTVGGVQYLGNMQPITVETDEPSLRATVSISADSAVIAVIPLSYTPASGRVSIDLADILRPYFEFKMMQSGDRLLLQDRMMLGIQVRFMDDDQPALRSRLIRGGIAGVDGNVEEWLSSNPLTWHARRKYVLYNQPEWLTLYVKSGEGVVYTVYTRKGQADPKGVQGLSQQVTKTGVYTFDVSPTSIQSLVEVEDGAYITHYTVTTTGGVEMQYILDSAKSEDERWFFFENSLGGFDTARFFGEEVLLISSEDKTLSRNDDATTYDVDAPLRWRQNTGSISVRERVWLLDFFRSPHRYCYRAGSLQSIVITESNGESNTSDNIYDYSFTYELSDHFAFINAAILEEPSPALTLPALGTVDFPLPPHPSDITLLTPGEGVFFAAIQSNAWGVIGYNQMLGSLQDGLRDYIDKLIKDYTAWYISQSEINTSSHLSILAAFSAQLKALREQRNQLKGFVPDVVKVALSNADINAQEALDSLRSYLENNALDSSADDFVLAVEDAIARYSKVIYIAQKSMTDKMTDEMLQQLSQMGENCNSTALGYATAAQQEAFNQAQAYTNLTAVTIDTAILSTQNLSIFIRSTEGLIIKQEPSTILSVGVRFNGKDVTSEVLEMTPAINFVWRRKTKNGVHDGMSDAEWESYAVGRHEIEVNRALKDKIRFWLETSSADDNRIIEQFRYKRK